VAELGRVTSDQSESRWIELLGIDVVERTRCATIGPMPHPSQYDSVTVQTKANVYFDGKVVSHTIHFGDGSRKTLGLIYPGTFQFGTDRSEQMDIVAGECSVVMDGSSNQDVFCDGNTFRIPGKSGFTITVAGGLVEYICSYL
jgi:purine/pyrimidine-nucleoside phosphorylase